MSEEVIIDANGKIVTVTSLMEDIAELKSIEEKLKKTNQLNIFINQVNQNIIHLKDERTLFDISCSLAIEFGKFNMVWIGLFDDACEKITLVAQGGLATEDIELFTGIPFLKNGPVDMV